MSDCATPDGSPPGSPVPGILQARTLEWVAISFSNAWKWKVKVKSLSRVRLFGTPWTAAYQAPPSIGFSRQEYWSGVPLPSPILEADRPKFGSWLNPVFPGGSDSKAFAYNVGDLGSIPGSGRFPGGGHGNPAQCSCLENPHGQRSLVGTVHGVTKSQTRVSDFTLLCSPWKPYYHWKWEEGFPGGAGGKESACPCWRCSSIPGWRRSPGVGNSNPLQDSCLEKNPWREEPGRLQSMQPQSWTWLSGWAHTAHKQ